MLAQPVVQRLHEGLARGRLLELIREVGQQHPHKLHALLEPVHLGRRHMLDDLDLARDLEHEVVALKVRLALSCGRPVVLRLCPCVELGWAEEV
eukprot:10074386-Alexandrium_andersonii.AAC.1